MIAFRWDQSKYEKASTSFCEEKEAKRLYLILATGV
jgi:hypothetical protein